jgi:peptide-methionine (R)-S-oxide reductase
MNEKREDGAEPISAAERMQQRTREYNEERRLSGKKDIPPATYNVIYSAIIVVTLKDAYESYAVSEWLADGAQLEALPLTSLAAPLLLCSYALFQLAFSFGTGQTTPFRLAVTKLGFTEPAFSSPLNDEKRDGDYLCSGCGSKLFDSSAKFDSGSGWPAFWRTHDGGITYEKELIGGRMEVKCQVCDSHLGHVFSDGPNKAESDTVPASDPGGPQAAFSLNDKSVHPRFCVNGAALKFEERQSAPGVSD